MFIPESGPRYRLPMNPAAGQAKVIETGLSVIDGLNHLSRDRSSRLSALACLQGITLDIEKRKGD